MEETKYSFNNFKEIMEKKYITYISPDLILIENKIGKGGFSNVYLSTYLYQKVAVKLLKQDVKIDLIVNEIKILSRLIHPYIPRFYGYSVFEDNKIGLILDYVIGKTLRSYLNEKNNLSKLEKLEIISKIIDLIEFLNFNNIIHRDLKTENLLINVEYYNNKKEFTLYLLDFGISIVSKKFKKIDTTLKGTLRYMAPENFNQELKDEDQTIDIKITNKIDIWSLGCIISEIFSNEEPWKSFEEEQLWRVYIEKKSFPIPEVIKDKNIINLIKRCTDYSIKDRYEISEIKSKISYIIINYMNHFKNNHNMIYPVSSFKRSKTKFDCGLSEKTETITLNSKEKRWSLCKLNSSNNMINKLNFDFLLLENSEKLKEMINIENNLNKFLGILKKNLTSYLIELEAEHIEFELFDIKYFTLFKNKSSFKPLELPDSKKTSHEPIIMSLTHFKKLEIIYGNNHYDKGHIDEENYFNGLGKIINNIDNSIYLGEIKKNLPEGYGEMIIGQVNAENKSSQRYKGSFVQGKFHGLGKLYKNGKLRFKGDFSKGKFSGIGILIMKSNDYFYGEWLNGLKHGKGEYYKYIKDNESYKLIFKGFFQNNKANGNAMLYYENGYIFEGFFENGSIEGEGKWFDSDGNIMNAIFKNSQLNGEATVLKNGVVMSKIMFEDGFLTGKNFLNNKGIIYEGDIRENLKHGHGKIVNTDGTNYDGDFKYGKYHGFGRLTMKDGKIYEGHFKYGHFDKEGVIFYSANHPLKSKIETFYEDGEIKWGKIYYKSGIIYEGVMKNTSEGGNGTIYYTDGSQYQGPVTTYHKRNGKGIMKILDKKSNALIKECEGNFINDNPHGSFKFYYPEKKQKEFYKGQEIIISKK